MDIYASDDEKTESIKQWWRDNGTSVAIGAVLGLSVLVGGRYWFSYQDAKHEEAAVVYFQAVQEAEATDELIAQFPASAYSVFAALESAKSASENKDFDKAAEYLQWVVDNAKLPAHSELARYRLAALLFEQDKSEQALNLLESSESIAFDSLTMELEGDIYVKQGNTDKARQAYQKAMAATESNDPRLGLLQIKLNDVAADNES